MSESQEQRATAPRTTLVEEGTAIKGTFASDCPIVVKGRIEGNVTGPSLTVSATGAVAGKVKVGVIESEGELSGEFEAEVVRLAGRVRDKTVIRAKSLEVKLVPEQGKMQVVFGECALDVGDMPSKQQVMAAVQSQHAAKEPAQSAAEPAQLAPVTHSGASSVEAPVSQADAKSAEPPAQAEPATVVQAQEAEKPERKNGRGRGHARPSTIPPPPSE